MFFPIGKKRTKLICFICNIALILQVIVFQFVYLDLRPSPSCHLGKLVIHDGDSEGSPVLRTFCTRKANGAFVTITNKYEICKICVKWLIVYVLLFGF